MEIIKKLTDENRYETTEAFRTSLIQPRNFKKSLLLYIQEMLSEWIGLPVGERAKAMIDF